MTIVTDTQSEVLNDFAGSASLPENVQRRLEELFPDDEEARQNVGQIIAGTREVLSVVEHSLTGQESKNRVELKRLAEDPEFFRALVELMDRISRPGDTKTMAEEACKALEDEAFEDMKGAENLMKRLFLSFGVPFHRLAVPRFINHIKKNASKFVLIHKGQVEGLGKKIDKLRRKTGIDYTVNIVAEDVHGQKQADSNIELCKQAIRDKNIRSIAVKPTSICPNVSPYAFDDTVGRMKDAMIILLEEVRDNPIGMNEDGTPKYKRITFDMEDSGTMEITVKAFKAAMKDIPDVPASIAVQAYMPETVAVIDDLAAFSKEDMKSKSRNQPRVGIRLVKGANMPLEKRNHSLNASLNPVFEGKIFTDANYQYCLDQLVSKHAGALNVTVASMNVRDILNAYSMAVSENLLSLFNFEMLKGMAAEETLEVIAAMTKEKEGRELEGKLSAYTPVIIEKKGEAKKWLESLAYLIRRLQEIRMMGCFLNALFTGGTDTGEWENQDLAFAEAYKLAMDNYGEYVEAYVKRIVQDRNTEVPRIEKWTRLEEVTPCSVTNFRFAENRKWLQRIMDSCNESLEAQPEVIPAQIGDPDKTEQKAEYKAEVHDSTCPARENKTFTKIERISEAGINGMYRIAENEREWEGRTLEERINPISKAVLAVQKNRAGLIKAGILDTGFTANQLDGEVSEMVEMYYAAVLGVRTIRDMEGYEPRPKGDGVSVVSCPWNFPLAIPWNGIINGLIAGNRVIVKPAPETEYATYQVVKLLWESGVPKDVLQFAPCDKKVTAYLGQKAKNMVLTGHSDTARKILSANPLINLIAETGGDNTKFVGASADLDVVTSTTVEELSGKSAQKCSAGRIMFVMEGVDIESLKKKLEDAIETLKADADTIYNLDADLGVMVLAAKRGKEYDKSWLDLYPGETWLVEPKSVDNGTTWTPGIKICKGLTASCKKEEFAPVLKIVVAEDIEEACKMANSLDHGLTSGYIGLDPDERDTYVEKIISGLKYVGRAITGAKGVIEPFGGVIGTLSKFGGGAHAAGPDYMIDLAEWEKVEKANYVARVEAEDVSPEAEVVRRFEAILAPDSLPEEISGIDKVELVRNLEHLVKAVTSYIHNQRNYFDNGFHPKKIEGQENYYEYHPFGKVVVRLCEDDNLYNMVAPVLANSVAGNEVMVSIPYSMRSKVEQLMRFGLLPFNSLKNVEFIYQDEESLRDLMLENLENEFEDRIKCLYYNREKDARKEILVSTGAANGRVWLRRGSFSENGRIALASCLQGSTVSNVWDRFGNRPKRATIRSLNGERYAKAANFS